MAQRSTALSSRPFGHYRPRRCLHGPPRCCRHPVAVRREARARLERRAPLLGPDELEALLAACPGWWRPYFTVAFWTGARPNELAALKWGDIDWAASRVRIRAGRYRGVESAPKTPASVRDVDLLPPVAETLRAQKAKQAAVRLKAGEGAPEPGRGLRLHWAVGRPGQPELASRWGSGTRTSAKPAYGLPDAPQLRQQRLAAGEAPSWVATQLGHTTPEMLFSVDARFIPNRTRRDGSALLGRMIGQPAQANTTGFARS